MPKSSAERLMFYPRDRQEWREWLQDNYATVKSVWIVYYKKDSGQPTITYDEAVEEALCYGWIDSTVNKLDDQRFLQFFSPRKSKTPWSALNKRRIEALIQQGLMAEPGLIKIETARRDGSWTLYDDIETLTVPDDLQAALNENETAGAYFAKFSPSSKKAILWWIKSAKRPETRAQRVEETVRLAALNKRATMDRA